MGEYHPGAAQVRLAVLGDYLVQGGQQPRPVLRQPTLHVHRIGGPQGGEDHRDIQALYQGADLLQLLLFPGLRPVPRLDFPVQPGFRKNRQHGGAHPAGAGLVEDFRGADGALPPFPRSGNACQVEEVVSDACPVQAAGLGDDVLRGIALVHEGQGLPVPGLHANGNAVIARPGQEDQLLVRFPGDICNTGKAADGFAPGKIGPDQLRDPFQPLRLQYEGVGSRQERPAGPLRLGKALHPQPQPLHGAGLEQLGLPEVGLHVLQGRHAEGEGQIIVQGAEFAAVMGAAGGGLQKQGVPLVGRPPDGSGKVHVDSPFSG